MIPIVQDTLYELVSLGYRFGDIENFLVQEVDKGNLIYFNEMYLVVDNYTAIYNPLRPTTAEEEYGYLTNECNWNELTINERLERINGVEQELPNGLVDWNDYPLAQLVEYLRNKYRFSTNGEAHAINRLIKFYEQKKDA
jgi:hypothetical protein